MARQVKERPHKQVAPSNLTMRLHAPGMSIVHRAGLGGLACTLARLETQFRSGQLLKERVPGAPWPEGCPPWTISEAEITLDFDEPILAGEFLKRLFAYAFGLKDELIFLPGQYGDLSPRREVRAYLQQGITLTFLQHGLTRKLSKTETTCSYEVDDKSLTIAYKACTGYKHRDGWQDLVDKQGRLTAKPIEVVGPLNPGAMVRHNAFSAQTRIEEPASRVLPLYFALVGCIALGINRGSGVLLAPDVDDLRSFAEQRCWMTPQTVAECHVTGACDAALQTQVRLRAKRLTDGTGLPGCFAATFQPRPWASQLKSRVHTVHVPPGDEINLDLFATVMQIPELAPHPVSRPVTETKGRGRQKKSIERNETFWGDSIVRPLIAENVALGRPWYEGFCRLMIEIDPVSKKPKRDKLIFERKGLHAMIEKVPWENAGESTVVKAVHEALGRRYGQIANENKGNPVAMKNRWKGEYDRWRLAFAGAKTIDQFRRVFCDMLSRAPGRGSLQEHWAALLPMLDASRWQLARDLALLALASYAGKGADVVEQVADDLNNQTATA